MRLMDHQHQRSPTRRHSHVFVEVDEVQAYGLRLFAPEPATLNLASLAFAISALVAIFQFKLGMIPTLFGSAGVGLAYYLLFLA